MRYGASLNSFSSAFVLQGALVLVLLVGVNVYSFRHYVRFDWTGR